MASRSRENEKMRTTTRTVARPSTFMAALVVSAGMMITSSPGLYVDGYSFSSKQHGQSRVPSSSTSSSISSSSSLSATDTSRNGTLTRLFAETRTSLSSSTTTNPSSSSNNHKNKKNKNYNGGANRNEKSSTIITTKKMQKGDTVSDFFNNNNNNNNSTNDTNNNGNDNDNDNDNNEINKHNNNNNNSMKDDTKTNSDDDDKYHYGDTNDYSLACNTGPYYMFPLTDWTPRELYRMISTIKEKSRTATATATATAHKNTNNKKNGDDENGTSSKTNTGPPISQYYMDSMIALCVAYDRWDDVLDLLSVMEDIPLEREASTYRACLQACYDIRKGSTAEDILHTMKKALVPISSYDIGIVIGTICRDTPRISHQQRWKRPFLYLKQAVKPLPTTTSTSTTTSTTTMTTTQENNDNKSDDMPTTTTATDDYSTETIPIQAYDMTLECMGASNDTEGIWELLQLMEGEVVMSEEIMGQDHQSNQTHDDIDSINKKNEESLKKGIDGVNEIKNNDDKDEKQPLDSYTTTSTKTTTTTTTTSATNFLRREDGIPILNMNNYITLYHHPVPQPSTYRTAYESFLHANKHNDMIKLLHHMKARNIKMYATELRKASMRSFTDAKRWDDALEVWNLLNDLDCPRPMGHYWSVLAACAYIGEYDTLAKEIYSQLLHDTEVWKTSRPTTDETTTPTTKETTPTTKETTKTKTSMETTTTTTTVDGVPDVLLALKVFDCFLNSCSKNGRWEEALSVLDQCKQFGFQPDRMMYTRAIRACKTGNSPKEGIQLFYSMKDTPVQPHGLCYEAAINCCLLMKDFDQVIELINEVEFQPLQTKNIVYTAVARQLLDKYERWDIFLLIFEKMEKEGVHISSQNFRAAIWACKETNQGQRAIEILNKMRDHGLLNSKDISIYGHVLSALYRESQHIVQQMSKTEYINEYHHNCNRNDNIKINDNIVDDNNTIEEKETKKYYNSNNNEKKRYRGNAYQLIQQMKDDGIATKEYCYISALHCCAWEYRWEDAMEIFSLMKKQQPLVQAVVATLAYQLVILACGRSDQPKIAYDFYITTAKKDGIRLGPASFLSMMKACRVTRDTETAHKVWDEFCASKKIPYPIATPSEKCIDCVSNYLGTLIESNQLDVIDDVFQQAVDQNYIYVSLNGQEAIGEKRQNESNNNDDTMPRYQIDVRNMDFFLVRATIRYVIQKFATSSDPEGQIHFVTGYGPTRYQREVKAAAAVEGGADMSAIDEKEYTAGKDGGDNSGTSIKHGGIGGLGDFIPRLPLEQEQLKEFVHFVLRTDFASSVSYTDLFDDDEDRTSVVVPIHSLRTVAANTEKEAKRIGRENRGTGTIPAAAAGGGETVAKIQVLNEWNCTNYVPLFALFACLFELVDMKQQHEKGDIFSLVRYITITKQKATIWTAASLLLQLAETKWKED